MKGLSIALCILFVLVALPALAADPTPQDLRFRVGISPGQLTPTPEMWFYEQYQREYQDPKMAVRKKAEFRAVQRERRLAAMKWFGFSNLRPQASSDPFHGDYSPGWKSNNTFFPFRWHGVGRPWILVHSNGSTWSRY